MWFAEDDGVLYVWTYARSGKVKRLRHTARVRVVPSGPRGNPRGEWVEGEARVVDGDAAARGRDLLATKYRWQWTLTTFMARRSATVIIAVRV